MWKLLTVRFEVAGCVAKVLTILHIVEKTR
jgi:hypothetical protein